MHKIHIKVLLVLTKVPRLYKCRSILSLGKIAHQMCCDHPFSQRNRTTERTVGLGFGGEKKVGGMGRWLDKIWKKRWKVGNYVKRLKVSHSPIIKPTLHHSWFPSFLVKISHPHYSHFWEIHPIPLWNRVGRWQFRLWSGGDI